MIFSEYIFLRDLKNALLLYAKFSVIALLKPVPELWSGMTIGSDFFKSLNYWNEFMPSTARESFIIYGGTQKQLRSQGTVIGWKDAGDLVKTIRSD